MDHEADCPPEKRFGHNDEKERGKEKKEDDHYHGRAPSVVSFYEGEQPLVLSPDILRRLAVMKRNNKGKAPIYLVQTKISTPVFIMPGHSQKKIIISRRPEPEDHHEHERHPERDWHEGKHDEKCEEKHEKKHEKKVEEKHNCPEHDYLPEHFIFRERHDFHEHRHHHRRPYVLRKAIIRNGEIPEGLTRIGHIVYKPKSEVFGKNR